MIIIKETFWKVLTHKYEINDYDELPFWLKVLTYVYPPVILDAFPYYGYSNIIRMFVLVFQIVAFIILFFMFAAYLSFYSPYSVNTKHYDVQRAEARAIRLFEEKEEKEYKAYILNHMKNCKCDTTHMK